MLLPQLNPQTAFTITALSSWSMIALLWVMGRTFPRQGVAWIMGSLASFGLGYMLIALSRALPTEEAMRVSYFMLGLGSSLAALGIRRFQLHRWSLVDGAIALLPHGMTAVWLALALNDFGLYARLSNAGFVLQIIVLCAILISGRKRMVGHGWKVMLGGLVIQALSVLPFSLPGSPPSTVEPVVHSLAEQLMAWALCGVMFLNLQLSVLSFLMMLQDRRTDNERQAAEVDVLTQLPNRRSLVRQLGLWLPLVMRQQGSVGIILLDIDHFKQVNDAFGHDAGDRVLQHVAGVLREVVRQGELLARYGGEEFVIVLRHADRQTAMTVAARVVEKVRNSPVQLGTHVRHITVSAGVHVQKVAIDEADGASGWPWHDWIRQADAAMYVAKGAGRNQFAVSPRSHGPVPA